MPCDSGRPTVAMTIGNQCPSMGNITDPLCHSGICDLEQKLSISMWKSCRVSTGKISSGFFFVFWDGGREVGREGGLCMCGFCVCGFVFIFVAWI